MLEDSVGDLSPRIGFLSGTFWYGSDHHSFCDARESDSLIIIFHT